MINLLPPEFAVRIKYGRANTSLRRWIIGALVAIGGLVIILAGGWLYLNSQVTDLHGQLDQTNAQLKAQNLSQVQKEASTITGDVKVINRVLDSEVRFSDLIQDIGKVMPSGTVLSSLTLDKINGPIDLSVNAKSYAAAAQVGVNLNDPANGLFSKVDIVSITCSNSSSSGPYACNGSFKALFSTSAIKKYQNVPGGS
ncbi:MAG TPA: hypothetical protein VFP35_00820 [Candidatus Saccharimonadales bacterium]|nr:hypothetical protein [Candidatus Saccharimonadales bacterium]